MGQLEINSEIECFIFDDQLVCFRSVCSQLQICAQSLAARALVLPVSMAKRTYNLAIATLKVMKIE